MKDLSKVQIEAFRNMLREEKVNSFTGVLLKKTRKWLEANNWNYYEISMNSEGESVYLIFPKRKEERIEFSFKEWSD